MFYVFFLFSCLLSFLVRLPLLFPFLLHAFPSLHFASIFFWAVVSSFCILEVYVRLLFFPPCLLSVLPYVFCFRLLIPLLRLCFVFRPRARFLTYLKRLWCTSLAPFGWIRLGDKVPLKPSSGLHVAWNLDPLHVMVI